MRNAKLLSDLKRKEPLYDVYVKTSEELLKLRQAHTVLISMIQSENLNIKQSKSSQSILQTGNQGGGFDKRAWDAVPGSIRVLELPGKGYGAGLKASLEALRAPMTNALRRMGPELAYLMVARDFGMGQKSCVEKQGSGGSATVKISVKIPKEVSYDYGWW